MLIVALVVALTFALSSAQPIASAQCVTAYNATFRSANGSNCSTAYLSLLSGAGTSQQEVMVCNSSQPCNAMLENIITLCSDTITNLTRSSLNLLCTTGPNRTCFSNLTDGNITSIYERLFHNCGGSCSQACMQDLILLNDTVGCCSTEKLQTLVEDGTYTSTQASFIANTYPEACGLAPYPLCNGSTLPADACDTAIVKLLGQNDECSRTVQQLFGGGDASLINLYHGDCPTRFHAYTTDCSALFGDGSNAAIQTANAIFAISQARISGGGNCTELGAVFLSDNEDEKEADCSRDYFINQCSTGCKQQLLDATIQYDCCLNTILAEFSGRSDRIHDQISFLILTREMYNLCGVSSGGFCNGTNPPSYITAAEQCISARNSFFGDSTCLSDYLILSKRLSATAVNSAATAICANQRCKNRMSSYVDFLKTCRVEYFLHDYSDKAVESAKHLEFAHLTGNTTCRVDSSNTSCYSSIYFNQLYNDVSLAFETDLNGSCVSAVNGSTCSPQCALILNMTSDSVGCCFGEYGRMLLGTDLFMTVLDRCNVTLVSDRCTEMEAVHDQEPVHDQDGDANAQTPQSGVGAWQGFGIIVTLLLGVIPITLS